MISNKTISIAAVGFAAANAITIQAKVEAEDIKIIDDILNWTEGAANDIADWTEGAVNDAADWTEKAFTDAGNWTENAFTDAHDWAKSGYNWLALVNTMGDAIITGFVDGDLEEGWNIFTDSSNYYGKKQVVNPKIKEFCAKNEPKVGQPTTPGGQYNFTEDFNYSLMKAGVPMTAVYAAFGDITDPNHQVVDIRACEAKDCLNPCYGKNQYGACNKCVGYMFEHDGARHDVCDLCVV